MNRILSASLVFAACVSMAGPTLSGAQLDADVEDALAAARVRAAAGDVVAQFSLCAMLYYGADDTSQAIAWCRRAAAQQYAPAEFHMGQVYDFGFGVRQDDAEALNFIDNISCHRLNMALRMICQDDLGKEAVRDGLKLVRLKNVKDKAAMRLTFEAGVLEMHCAYALRTDDLQEGDVLVH